VKPSRIKRIVDSDDEGGDDGWMEQRASLTASQKAENIQTAKNLRIGKRQGALVPKMVDTPQDAITARRVNTSGLEDTPDGHVGSLDKARAIFEQKRENRLFHQASNSRDSRSERRKDNSLHKPASSSRKSQKKAAVNVPMSDEESFEDSSGSDSDSDSSGEGDDSSNADKRTRSDRGPAGAGTDTGRPISGSLVVDLTDNTPPRRQHRGNGKPKTAAVLDNSDESDQEGWAYADKGKTDVMTRAQKILRQCKSVSHNLRTALVQWSGGGSDKAPGSGSGSVGVHEAPAGEEQGCLNITSINMQPSATAGADAEAISEILTEVHIRVKCPDLTLKDYQFVGVNWLKLLYQYNINGVLADDMGLGKTVQTVAFLGWIKSQQELRGKRVKRPHLIVVPASTLSNWLNEMKRFCPALSVVNYHGSQAERSEMRRYLRRHADDVDVIFSTYTIFERESGADDRHFLYGQSFDYLVLDEAHCIKNSASSRFHNLNRLNTKHRLLLSGTPVQNDVSELLSLLSFLMPRVFAQQDCALLLEAFGWNSSSTREKVDHKSKANALQIKQLRSMMAPFVLRRIKRDVLTQLVDKIGVVTKVKMTTRQASVYEGILLEYAAKKERQRLLVMQQDEQINRLNMVKSFKMKTSESTSSLSSLDLSLAERAPRGAATAAAAAMSAQSKIFNSTSLSVGLNKRKFEDEVVDLTVEAAQPKVGLESSPVRVASNGDLTLLDADTTMSSSEAKHLFTTLRKAANHPLLLRIRYSDTVVLDRIAQVAHNHGHFGQQCDVARVRQELDGFSDFDLHQLCAEYPKYLSSYTLPAEVLYDSPKMVQLKEMLPKLISENHRVLIFSQWTRLLDLLEVLLNEMDLGFLRLDGSTPVAERQALIDMFNVPSTAPPPGPSSTNGVVELVSDSDEESASSSASSSSSDSSSFPSLSSSSSSSTQTRYNVNIFLLSTKAGGLGINLTSADTVILHDLDFNPENDRQAEDRCHRIGQTKPVTVYKLVTDDTVDVDIFNMGERKQVLSNAVLGDNRGAKKARAGEADTADDIGAIGRILQGALARVRPAAASAPSRTTGANIPKSEIDVNAK